MLVDASNGEKDNDDLPDLPAVDYFTPDRVDPHILTMDRMPVPFSDEDTTTGRNKRALVIRPHVLREGLAYLIQVDVMLTGMGIVYPLANSCQ